MALTDDDYMRNTSLNQLNVPMHWASLYGSGGRMGRADPWPTPAGRVINYVSQGNQQWYTGNPPRNVNLPMQPSGGGKPTGSSMVGDLLRPKDVSRSFYSPDAREAAMAPAPANRNKVPDGADNIADEQAGAATGSLTDGGNQALGTDDKYWSRSEQLFGKSMIQSRNPKARANQRYRR